VGPGVGYATAWSVWKDKIPIINGSVNVGESTLRVGIVAVCWAQLTADWRLVYHGAQLLLAYFQELVYRGKAGRHEPKRELGAISGVVHRR